MTDRIFSISASLLALISTPGKTAPVASLTIPVNALCAWRAAGSTTKHTTATITTNRIRLPLITVTPFKADTWDQVPAIHSCRATITVPPDISGLMGAGQLANRREAWIATILYIFVARSQPGDAFNRNL